MILGITFIERYWQLGKSSENENKHVSETSGCPLQGNRLKEFTVFSLEIAMLSYIKGNHSGNDQKLLSIEARSRNR